jgi:BirA family biotin operon repressor/biotin-[acetyl-CoA-carboxylase] ligase
MKIEAHQPGFLGKVKILLDEVDSTQTFAAQLLRDSPVTHGTLVMARSQFMGQGRLGKSWHSNTAENFTGSLILKHYWNTVPPPFALSQVVALSVHNLVEDITGSSARIKWPNDILVSNKKVSGILISNQWKGQLWESSIVGIGINVNQISFDISLPQAASLINTTGKPLDMNDVINRLMSFLNAYYLQLITGNLDKIIKEYHKSLYGISHPVKIIIQESGHILQAQIKEVLPSGEIKLKMENGDLRLFDLDQISILLP